MNYTEYISVKFLTELALMTACCVLHCERRSRFWVKLPLCVILCYTFSYYSSPVFLRYHLWDEPAASAVYIARYIAIFALVALAVRWLFELSVRASFFICAGAYAVQHIAKILYGLIEELYLDRVPLPVVVILYVIYLVVFYAGAHFVVVRRLRQEDAVQLRADETFLFNVLSVVGFIVLDRFSSGLEPVSGMGRVALAGYGVICGVFLLFLQMNIFEKGAIIRENEKTEFILEQERKRFESFRDGVDYLNIKCHDLKHQIHRLKQASVVQAETIAELEDGISQYESYSNTGFPALDIILGEKYLACKAKGIEFTALVDGEKLSRLSESDVYSLFGNALDNAIECEEKLPEGSRLIRLSVKDIGNMLFIRVENTYEGPDVAGEELETSKADKQYHGFGIKSMRHIVEKYGGEMDVNTANGLFRLTCMFTV